MATTGVTPYATQGTTDTGSTSKAAAKAATDVQSTFLSLLTTELKAQDPTSAMDSTTMVNQMIALNQLNQVIAIREMVQAASKTTTTDSNSQNNSSTGSK
jgi:flagellar basal-body rod modification protein FlgD